ncbi:dual specificity protein phosphatase family protein [bacterium]|nr:dual specificity protein phosphatase family protein [bacterium]
MSEITPQLFLGNENNARNLPWLRSKGITHIVNISQEVPNYFPGKFGYLNFKIDDIPSEANNLAKNLYQISLFIDSVINSGGKVLVHCRAGVSRSASVVIYYLMKKYKVPYTEALKYVRSKRWIVNPNPGFVQILRNI